MFARIPSTLVRLWRLAALAAAALLLHKQSFTTTRAGAFVLSDAQAFFPRAAVLAAQSGGSVLIKDSEGGLLGSLVTTSPAADRVFGYSGSSNLLVALDPEGRIVGTRILGSDDTPAHVDALRRSGAFSKSLIGWTPSGEHPPKIEGVGGSTLTGLAMVEGIAERLGGRHGSLRFPESVALEEARRAFPSAAEITPDASRNGWLRVTGASGNLVGYLVRTAPASDSIIGYAGPTECLVAVHPDAQTIAEIRIRKSYDTDEYVERVVEERDYLKSLAHWGVSEWPGLDFKAGKIEGVAGATMTSAAVAEGLRETFRKKVPLKSEKSWGNMPLRDVALWLFLLGACAMSFTKLRGIRWLRLAWQAGLVVGLGLWLGHFVSLGLLAGWADNGLSLRQVGPLLLLAGVSLLVPWAARRQIYCHHLCPHGAAQEWLGRLVPGRFKIQLAPSLHRALRLFPAALLIFAFLWALRSPSAALGNLEPFDFWILGSAAVFPCVLAVAGWMASAFVPMAYCRYGCPTGALLAFLRTASGAEAFSARDLAAFAVLVAGGLLTLGGRTAVSKERYETQTAAEATTVKEIRGNAFGTTWCVKIRSGTADLADLRARISCEIERIESSLSHWSAGSATSRFNRSESTADQQVPEELGMLVQFAQHLSHASSGAFDITVAPLVDAWGYGPSGSKALAPSSEEIAALLEQVGSEKLSVAQDGKSLRKAHPKVALDLGSILQGYAVDQVAALLERNGCGDFLVEIGGELRARGAWTVAIENPADAKRPLLVMELKDAALATSGLSRARRKLSGETVSHILSPRSGRPVPEGLEVCSVLMPTCLEADGWATALIASGLVGARDVAAREQLRAWVLDARGGFREWVSAGEAAAAESHR